MNKAYLLISGRLYLTTGDCAGTDPGNLYPCSLGDFSGKLLDLPVSAGGIYARHGQVLTLFGRRYEVNDLHRDGREFVEDEIDLELVLLCEPGDPEGDPGTCAACGRVLEDCADGRLRCPDLSYHTADDFPREYR
jgi:hypothetical protein